MRLNYVTADVSINRAGRTIVAFTQKDERPGWLERRALLDKDEMSEEPSKLGAALPSNSFANRIFSCLPNI